MHMHYVLTYARFKAQEILGEGENGQFPIPRQDTPSKTAHRLQGHPFGKVDMNTHLEWIFLSFSACLFNLKCHLFTVLPCIYP